MLLLLPFLRLQLTSLVPVFFDFVFACRYEAVLESRMLIVLVLRAKGVSLGAAISTMSFFF